MPIQLIRANALDLPLADGSVDLVVTSPPYFGLRSYQDGGEHYAGQIGDEATPTEFVDALLAATREMVRVLKPSGSIWVNLGDKYNGYSGNRGEGTIQSNGPRQSAPSGSGLDVKGVRAKSLIGIPWRYALRCIDDLGLILRAEVCWSKPNGLPESVTDRVRRSHETWFHFTKSPRYYSAVDEIRERHLTVAPGARSTGGTGYEAHMAGRMNGSAHLLGKLPGSVWSIPTEPLTVPDYLGIDHYAAFPMEWPRRLITGWSPAAICTACGEGRVPVAHVDLGQKVRITPTVRRHREHPRITRDVREDRGHECACPDSSAPSSPGVVLDPFGGTGTTALVADALGRHGISVDMSADYLRIAQWRTTDPRQRAKAAQRDYTPPPPQIEGQAAFQFHEGETA